MEDGDDEKTRFVPAPRKDDGSRVDGPQTGDDKTQIINAADDDRTHIMSAADDDKTHIMTATDGDDAHVVAAATGDDKTHIVPNKATDKAQGMPPLSSGDETRLMSADTDQQDAPAQLPGKNDATRLMSSADASADPANTQVMPETGDNDTDSNPTMVDGSAERDVGKTVIKDRFVLDKILGAGGMGSVYKAKDLRKVEARDRNPWVAVKLLNEDFKTHPGSFMSLQREARKSQTLAHPNIIQVYDFDREGDMVFMTMELLQGTVLSDYIKSHPEGIEVEEALRLTREMGAALQHAHSHNITHADFKPGNVFILENGTAKVLDFGIAQAVAHVDVEAVADEKTAFDPSSLGALTPAYASLEMLLGEVPLPSDDIYALGCIAYQLLSGKHPFDKMPADEAATKGKRPAKIEKLDRKRWRALQKAMAFKRADRYETVAEFLRDFAPWANPWAKRLGLAVGIALMLGGIGIYQAVSNYYQEDARNAEVRQRKAELTAESGLIKVQQEAKSLLDLQFSGLRAAVDGVESQLDQHRFAFQATHAWQQRMRSLLAQLALLYEADDWKATLYENKSLDVSVLEAMEQKEQARRNQAIETSTVWMVKYQEKVAEDYLALASAMARDGHFVDAQANIDEASGLHPNAPKLLETKRQLEALIAVNRRENEAVAQSAREAEQQRARFQLEANFQTDDAAVGADLKACTETLSRTGRGGRFAYDIQALEKKTIALQSKYATLGEQVNIAIGAYIKELGACIQLFGYSDPAAAKQQLEVAKQSFPAYAENLSVLPIYPWNTCKPSFAGKGERYDCQDRFLGESRKGPVLVVISAENGMPEFAIGKYEITEDQFNIWCQATDACEASTVGGTLPVTGRSVTLISQYITWLSESTGFNYQLPTRQQWLHAAHAGGAELDPGRNCSLKARGIVKGQVLLPVELGANNPWGLIHHVGNARELVRHADGFHAAGGSRTDPMDDCTVQAIAPVDGNGDSVTGFRVVRTRE